jgi:type I restriction enzyme S subunit
MGDPVARACIVPQYHSRYLMCSDGIRLVVDCKKHNSNFIFLSINSPEFTGVSSKNKGKTVDMLIWCGIKNFYK